MGLAPHTNARINGASVAISTNAIGDRKTFWPISNKLKPIDSPELEFVPWLPRIRFGIRFGSTHKIPLKAGRLPMTFGHGSA